MFEFRSELGQLSIFGGKKEKEERFRIPGRPSRFLACNIEKTGCGLGTRLLMAWIAVGGIYRHYFITVHLSGGAIDCASLRENYMLVLSTTTKMA